MFIFNILYFVKYFAKYSKPEICLSYCAIELFFMKGIYNLYHAKKETQFQAFSCKPREFLHNDNFWDLLRIILCIFGWLLPDFLLLNWLFANAMKIINLTILKLYPVKLTRISFLMKSRFILCNYCAIRDANYSFVSLFSWLLVPLEETF